MLATFNGTWDWTAIGTLALALMTLLLASATLWMVMLARRSLAQTQDEIALSRREVEEAHQRVLVPYQKSARMLTFRGGAFRVSGGPHVTENDPERKDLPRYSAVLLPVENVGAGPALNVRGEFAGPRGTGTARFPTEAVAVGGRGVVGARHPGVGRRDRRIAAVRPEIRSGRLESRSSLANRSLSRRSARSSYLGARSRKRIDGAGARRDHPAPTEVAFRGLRRRLPSPCRRSSPGLVS